MVMTRVRSPKTVNAIPWVAPPATTICADRFLYEAEAGRRVASFAKHLEIQRFPYPLRYFEPDCPVSTNNF